MLLGQVEEQQKHTRQFPLGLVVLCPVLCQKGISDVSLLFHIRFTYIGE